MEFPYEDFFLSFPAITYAALFFIVFAESGLFLGAFLPADSLLFALSFLSAEGFFNLWAIILVALVGAMAGDVTAFIFGDAFGSRLFLKEHSLLFDRKYLDRAHLFFEQHGPATLVFGRFLPGVRIVAPLLAGFGTMRYRTFLFYDGLGVLLWVSGTVFLGHILGDTFPSVSYVLPLITIIALALFSLMGVIRFFKNRLARLHFQGAVEKLFRIRPFSRP